MARKSPHELSRRERQIMDIIHTRQEASAAEVMEAMADPPSYSAVRALLAVLERKALVKHREEGRKYIYRPTTPSHQIGRGALERVMRTFFDGSVEKALAALLDSRDSDLSPDELDRLRALIDRERKEGR
jgi:predicted transcriptional regulator